MAEGWRKITMADVRRGVTVRIMGGMSDTAYNGATIISARKHPLGKSWEATLARPYCYASDDYNSRQPLVGAEVYDVTIGESESKQDASLEVYEGRDGCVRMMSVASSDHRRPQI